MTHRRIVMIALAASASLAGCGSSSELELTPVRGEVTYNGKPLTSGIVGYLPTRRGEGRAANGPIEADGTFVLTTLKRHDGVMKGAYQIVIYAYDSASEPKTREEIEAQSKSGRAGRPRSLVPEKYADPETSGLTDVVDAGHSGFKKIELTD